MWSKRQKKVSCFLVQPSPGHFSIASFPALFPSPPLSSRILRQITCANETRAGEPVKPSEGCWRKPRPPPTLPAHALLLLIGAGVICSPIGRLSRRSEGHHDVFTCHCNNRCSEFCSQTGIFSNFKLKSQNFDIIILPHVKYLLLKVGLNSKPYSIVCF